MLTTMRSVVLKLPSATPGAGPAPPPGRPFDAFQAGALRLACPFAIVRAPSQPVPPDGGPVRAA